MVSATAMGLRVHAILLRVRKEKGLTQEQVSERLGMSRTEFSRVENGHRDIGSEKLFRWAALLDVELCAIAHKGDGK